MADLSNYTHKWRAVTNPQNSDGDKVTKRNRIPLSCHPCRIRKLRCSRGHPCDGCMKRSEPESCIYGKTSNSPSGTQDADLKYENRSSTKKAQDRLKRLEDLVKSMVESSPQTKSSTSSSSTVKFDSSQSPSEPNQFSPVSETTTSSAPWSTVLQYISELRAENDIDAIDNEDENDVDFAKPDALFGASRPPSLEHVLRTYLPPRGEVDRHISHYFSAKYMIIPFLHARQFQRYYELFWQDPPNFNPTWVSIMFSVCCLAVTMDEIHATSGGRTSDATAASQNRDHFQAAAAQCLNLGNYSKPQPFIIEALGLFLQCKYFISLDPQREVALMFSVQSRLAFFMGYHRDASNFPNRFTAFEAEMRRRCWAMVKQFDLMVSFQLSIPSSIPPDSWDTKNPQNLRDMDFDEDSQQLPLSRPETDVTTLLYFMYKSRIVDVFIKIWQHAYSLPKSPPTLESIMALDTELRSQVDVIPESLKVRSIAQSITDPAHDIIARMNISYLWRKALCVLHRKYMVGPSNEYSYTTCVTTATNMCLDFLDLYPEFQPGGTHELDSWMISSFMIQDFLHAIIILCLAMSVSRKKYLDDRRTAQMWLKLEETMKVLDILDKSHTVCLKLAARSREAKRVSSVIDVMLKRLRTTTTQDREVFIEPNGYAETQRSNLDASKSRNGSGSLNGITKDFTTALNVSDSVTEAHGRTQPTWQMSQPSDSVATIGDNGAQTAYQNYATDVFMPDSVSTEIQGQQNNGFSSFPQSYGMDIALDPFSNIINGLEDQNLNSIDWTQFDRLMGPNANDPTLNMFSFPALPYNTGPMTSIDPMDFSSWESTPIYSLGGRARDPVTGKSQKT